MRTAADPGAPRLWKSLELFARQKPLLRRCCHENNSRFVVPRIYGFFLRFFLLLLFFFLFFFFFFCSLRPPRSWFLRANRVNRRFQTPVYNVRCLFSSHFSSFFFILFLSLQSSEVILLFFFLLLLSASFFVCGTVKICCL